MTNTRPGALDQFLDIKGSSTQSDSLSISDEPNKIGKPISGQLGLIGSITTVSSGIATLTGLSGFSTASIGRIIIISNAANAGNNGIFIIASFISASSITIENTSAVALDANNGSISWSENEPYTLEDDLNYNRSNIKLIKGTSNWHDDIPEYIRPTDTLTDIPVNLANISSKILDAHAWMEPRFKKDITISPGVGFVTVTESGNLKHSDSVDTTGIPTIDGYDSGNEAIAFVEIVDAIIDGYSDGANLRVIFGAHSGERIFGLTREGSSTSPDSVEVAFYSTSIIDWDLSTITPYFWENGQPTTVNISYGYRQRLDLFDENAIRSVLIQGALSGGSSGSGGGSSVALPTPSQVGQVLFAAQVGSFTVELPLTSTEGWLCSDEGILICVG